MEKLTINELYQKMIKTMGNPNWWPAETNYEIIIGAILIQNTNWKNVDQSLQQLQKATDLDPKRILKLTNQELERLIRPSGFYKGKAQCLLDTTYWLKNYNFDFSNMRTIPKSRLGSQLLSIKGIGNETRDAILLYVFRKPVFIADQYARRLVTRLGLVPPKNYVDFQKLIEANACFSTQEWQEFHGLIVEFGKTYLSNRRDKWMSSFLSNNNLEFKC